MTPRTEAEIRIQVRDVGVAAERHRCVTLLQAEIRRQRVLGHSHIADLLEALATRLAHPELEP